MSLTPDIDGTCICIFESLHLEGSYIGGLTTGTLREAYHTQVPADGLPSVFGGDLRMVLRKRLGFHVNRQWED